MCDQQRLRPDCVYAQSGQSLCLSVEYCMFVKLLTERHFDFLSLKGVQARPSLHLSKYHIVGNHMSRLICHMRTLSHTNYLQQMLTLKNTIFTSTISSLGDHSPTYSSLSLNPTHILRLPLYQLSLLLSLNFRPQKSLLSPSDSLDRLHLSAPPPPHTHTASYSTFHFSSCDCSYMLTPMSTPFKCFSSV